MGAQFILTVLNVLFFAAMALTGPAAAAPQAQTHGMEKPWLGVGLDPVTPEEARALGLEGLMGARLSLVYNDHPQRLAGFSLETSSSNLTDRRRGIRRNSWRCSPAPGRERR